MHPENLEKLGQYLKSRNFEAALLSNPFTITWLTGYSSFIQTGPSPFEGGPPLGWYHQGELTLLTNDWETGAAEATGVNVHSYVGYTVEEPLACTQRMGTALADMLKSYVSLKGAVGVEMNTMPAALYLSLQVALPHANLVNLDTRLDPLRAVKTAAEIEKIKAALQLSDLAQATIRTAIQPGVTELELYELVKAKIEY